MVGDEASTRIAHMADAALLQYAGWSWGDYQEWVESDPENRDWITQQEWEETEKFGNFVHDATARWLADVEKEVKEDVERDARRPGSHAGP